MVPLPNTSMTHFDLPTNNNHKWWTSKWFLLSAGVVVIIGVVFLTLWLTGVLPKSKSDTSDSKKITIKSSNTSQTSRNSLPLLEKARLVADQHVPTDEEQATYNITSEYRIVEFHSPDEWQLFTDMENWVWIADIPYTEGQEGHRVIFGPRGANDLVFPITGIASEFYSMYVVLEDHMWNTGFQPGQSSLTEAKVEAFKTLSENAHTLVGTPGSPVSEDTTSTIPFSYDTSSETIVPINPLPESTVIPSTITGERKNGVLMLASDHVSYTVKINGQERKVRVLLNRYHPDFKLMGVKQVFHEGQWWYYDEKEKKLVTEPNANIRSFWNQHQYDYPDDYEENPSEKNEKELLTSMYQSKRYGIPIEVMNQDFDFNTLKNSNLVMDIFSTGSMGFLDAKSLGYTEASLAEDPVALLKLFELRNLQTVANFSTA